MAFHSYVIFSPNKFESEETEVELRNKGFGSGKRFDPGVVEAEELSKRSSKSDSAGDGAVGGVVEPEVWEMASSKAG
jgi:hypothetical protein